MTIPSVMHGLIELEDGKVFELDSSKGSAWLESIGSFRFEPSADNKPYTVRKEVGKGGDYWYGYRKQNGKLHKKYIGKSSELSTAKLEEIAEALNTPPQPRVTDKVTDKVTDTINQSVTDRVTDTVTVERFTALELQVQALQESLEALRSELPGKSDAGNSEELPTVTDAGLQIELGNLKAENERLQSEYSKLLASSHVVTEKLREEVREVRSQLETEKTRWDELREELDDREETCGELRSELSDLKQKSATTRTEFPEAADLLNRLRAKMKADRKKSTAGRADIEALVEILKES